MVNMTSYWDAYKLDIPMQRLMAMAMMMMSSERKPPSMPKSHNESHTVIADCGFHRYHCVRTRQRATLGTSYECEIG